MLFQHQNYISASVLFVANMSCIECIAVSHHKSITSCPPHSCPSPFVTSSFSVVITTFLAILRSSSQTSIGRKSASLSRCTSLLAVYVPSNEALFWNLISLIQVWLIKSGIALQASDVKQMQSKLTILESKIWKAGTSRGVDSFSKMKQQK